MLWLQCRVPNCSSGLASFGAQHRILDWVNFFIAQGVATLELRPESLGPVQDDFVLLAEDTIAKASTSPDDPGPG